MKLIIFFLLSLALLGSSCSKPKQTVHFTIVSQEQVFAYGLDKNIITNIYNDGDLPSGPVFITIEAIRSTGEVTSITQVFNDSSTIRPGESAKNLVSFQGLKYGDYKFKSTLSW